jgi:citronellol/citronellal dehydrogenase
MFDINVRGTFMVTKFAYPLLKASENPHILTLSPPLNMDMKWFKHHLAYTLTKYNMSMMAMGWAEEFKKDRIASNTLWPASIIATAAIRNLPGGEELLRRSRKPEIMADAAFYILQKEGKSNSGNAFIDEAVLNAAGIINLAPYALDPDSDLHPDLFL